MGAKRNPLSRLSDSALHAAVQQLTDRMRGQQGEERRATFQDIAALIRVRRALSEETRAKLARPRREWQRED